MINELSATDFVQPIEKLLLNAELGNDNENSIKQNNDTPISDECLCICYYDHFEVMYLKEEDNNNYLSKY